MFWYVQGSAYQQMGDSKKAVSAYQSAIKQNPAFIPALSALIKVYLAGGEPSLALEHATHAVEVKRTDPELKLLRATALLRNRRLAEARAELTALIRANPGMESAHLQFGQTLTAEKRYGEAKAVFQKLYRPGQADLRPLEGLAVAYAATGQPQRAIDLMNAELIRSSSPNGVREVFGRLALLMKKPDIAIEQYTELTRSEPNTARTHRMLAEALRAKGDSPAAIASLEKAERLDPNDPVLLSALAPLLQDSGRSSESVGRLRRVLELRPGDTNTMNNLAYALAESGVNLDEARQLAQKAVRAAPNQHQILKNL